MYTAKLHSILLKHIEFIEKNSAEYAKESLSVIIVFKNHVETILNTVFIQSKRVSNTKRNKGFYSGRNAET
jgi:hypothetical protein